MRRQDEADRKPGSVPPHTAGGDDHSSGTYVTVCLKRPNPEASGEPPLFHWWSRVGPSGNASLFGLAPGGVYRASNVTIGTGALLPHRFTLTTVQRAVLLPIAGDRQCRAVVHAGRAVCFLWHFP
jgi:hypothetical protein